jgi:hypothetical protein
MSTEAVAGQLQRMVQGVEGYRWRRGYSMDVDISAMQASPYPGDEPQVGRVTTYTHVSSTVPSQPQCT